MKDFDWGLSYFDPDDKTEYKFYLDSNQNDPDSSVKLYCKKKCLSDNYFAYNELATVMLSIYEGEITDYSMSSVMKYNYKGFVKELEESRMNN